jgi:2'-5' RNA ligase
LVPPQVVALDDHSSWRPKWTPGRTCLYWYVTFRRDEIVRAVGHEVLDLVRGTSWLDAVPPEWFHVTIADVGFSDRLEPSDAESVLAAVAEALTAEHALRLTLGPVRTTATAVVLGAGPLRRLRDLKSRVRRATTAAIGERHQDFHRRTQFWPHVTLGYAHEAVPEATLNRFRESLPAVDGRVDVEALTLVAVTREVHGYRWDVLAPVELDG